MNSFMFIVNILLLLMFLSFAIKTFIDLKKSEGKLLEEVKPKLLKDINIMLVLTVLLFLSTIVNILIRR